MKASVLKPQFEKSSVKRTTSNDSFGIEATEIDDDGLMDVL
jgi:hypothetical protein